MKLENNLDTDDIKGLVWRLAFPSMLAQFVSVLYSIVDRMYIGNIPEIGEAALAGVGVCGPIVTLVSSFAFLVGVGGAPLMSIRLGEKNERAASQILANCFLMLAVLSAVLTVASLALRETLLWKFGAGEGTFGYAKEYITIYLMGTVFALMTTVYYLSGICKNRHEVSDSGSGNQYCPGSGIYFCPGYGGKGGSHCHCDFPGGVLHLCPAFSVQ